MFNCDTRYSIVLIFRLFQYLTEDSTTSVTLSFTFTAEGTHIPIAN